MLEIKQPFFKKLSNNYPSIWDLEPHIILFPKQNPETKPQNYQEKLKLSQLSRPKSDLHTITIKAKVKNASFRSVKNEPRLLKKKTQAFTAVAQN